MRKDLDNYLVQKYPKIFIDRYASMKQSGMGFGFQCRDGWFRLIENLCCNIQSYIDWNQQANPVKQIVATTIKEKFGRLSFYYDGGDAVITGMVRFAEHLSYHICEECGDTHKVGKTSGWITILCEWCSKKDEYKNRPWELLPESKFDDASKEVRKIKLDKLSEGI